MRQDDPNSGELLPVPVDPPASRLGPVGPAAAPPPWVIEEEDEGLPIGRYLTAMWRRKWVLVASGLIGVAVAFYVWRSVAPTYVVDASVRLNNARQQAAGPMAAPVFNLTGWATLINNSLVLDTVVMRKRLYLQGDARKLASLVAGASYSPGNYLFTVSQAGDTYTLRRTGDPQVETGRMGDRAGEFFGFRWTPDPRLFEPGEQFGFTLTGVRDASGALGGGIMQVRAPDSEIMTLRMEGTDPAHLTSVLNEVLDVYESTARRMKEVQQKQRMDELEEQDRQAAQLLADIEAARQEFLIATITEPSSASGAAIGGVTITAGDPAVTGYRALRKEVVDKEYSIRQIDSVLADTLSGGALRIEVLERLPDVRASSLVNAALVELAGKRAERTTLLVDLTEAHPDVITVTEEISRLESTEIPRLTRDLRDAIRTEIQLLEGRIEAEDSVLRAIPERTTQSEKYTRDLASATASYTQVHAALLDARISAITEVPDVTVLTRAQEPSVANSDDRVRLGGMALAGCLLLGALLALFLERSDSTVRYPEHVTSELGLTILGGIPKLRGGAGANSDQALEAFRDLRLNVMYAYGSAGPIVLALSSPGASEGKSFISANLAIVFAELGRKTLLLDGDARRGAVQELFGLSRKPGLVDFLAGTAEEDEAIRRTSVANLDVIPSGTRSQHAPELLASSKMRAFMGDLKKRYEVIIVDTPPLGAGADAFLLSTLTGNLAMVLRTGASDRDLAAARLEPLDRLPIRLLGAILNDVSDKSSPGYYYAYYLPGYGAHDESDTEGAKKIAAAVASASEPIAGADQAD